MSKSVTPTLDEALALIRKLPNDTQEALATEMIERAGSLTQSFLSDEQRAVVKERLSAPRELAPRADVLALFRKYCPNL